MSRIGRNRVLVVDDLADAADCLAMLLGLWGYDTEVCYGGAAVLELALIFRPQVVLLDVGMPDLDGFEVSRRLRARPECASTVIIGISGYGNESDRSRGRLAGFAYYLLKPVEPALLQNLLSRLTSAAEFATPAGLTQQEVGSATPFFPEIVSACLVSGNLPTAGTSVGAKEHMCSRS